MKSITITLIILFCTALILSAIPAEARGGHSGKNMRMSAQSQYRSPGHVRGTEKPIIWAPSRTGNKIVRFFKCVIAAICFIPILILQCWPIFLGLALINAIGKKKECCHKH